MLQTRPQHFKAHSADHAQGMEATSLDGGVWSPTDKINGFLLSELIQALAARAGRVNSRKQTQAELNANGPERDHGERKSASGKRARTEASVSEHGHAATPSDSTVQPHHRSAIAPLFQNGTSIMI